MYYRSVFQQLHVPLFCPLPGLTSTSQVAGIVCRFLVNHALHDEKNWIVDLCTCLKYFSTSDSTEVTIHYGGRIITRLQEGTNSGFHLLCLYCVSCSQQLENLIENLQWAGCQPPTCWPWETSSMVLLVHPARATLGKSVPGWVDLMLTGMPRLHHLPSWRSWGTPQAGNLCAWSAWLLFTCMIINYYVADYLIVPLFVCDYLMLALSHSLTQCHEVHHRMLLQLDSLLGSRLCTVLPTWDLGQACPAASLYRHFPNF